MSFPIDLRVFRAPSFHLQLITKASLLGGPLGEASAGVVVYANEVSRGVR